jgi:spore coat protein U-like protein
VKALKLTAAALALALASLAGSASAATSNGTLNASVQITDGCLATSNTLSFGNIGLLRTNKDAQTNVSVFCTSALPYTIKIFDAADAAATTFTMKNGANNIGFQLFQDASRTMAWDSTNGRNGTGIATGNAQTLVLYGRIPAQTSRPEGHYEAQMRMQIDY